MCAHELHDPHYNLKIKFTEFKYVHKVHQKMVFILMGSTSYLCPTNLTGCNINQAGCELSSVAYTNKNEKIVMIQIMIQVLTKLVVHC
jgi:hypothetical protein